METKQKLTSYCVKTLLVFLLFITVSHAQIAKVEIVGGDNIVSGSTTTITAGTSLNFRITNSETGNCDDLEIQNVIIGNPSKFSVTPSTASGFIRPANCAQWWWFIFGIKSSLDFKVKNNSSNCAVESTLITLKIRNRADFTFTLRVDSSPKINVLGGSPLADVNHNSTVTSDVNGTYFGIIEAGATKKRDYIIVNTGSCPLSITAVSITAGDFSIPASFSATVNPGAFTVLPVTFTGPTGGAGAKTSTVNISNNANTTFSFNVSAEMFDENIPGPGGVLEVLNYG